jgi:hypothetical protein
MLRRSRGPTTRRGGERGEVDGVDLVVGVILLVLVPVFFYIGGRSFLTTKSEKGLFREQPEVPSPPLDKAEIEMRWTTCRDLYEKNAKEYASTLKTVEDGALKEHHRRWAVRSLANADSNLSELAADISRDLEGKTRFASYLSEIESLKRQIAADKAELEALDVLGRDGVRRGLSEADFAGK